MRQALRRGLLPRDDRRRRHARLRLPAHRRHGDGAGRRATTSRAGSSATATSTSCPTWARCASPTGSTAPRSCCATSTTSAPHDLAPRRARARSCAARSSGWPTHGLRRRWPPPSSSTTSSARSYQRRGARRATATSSRPAGTSRTTSSCRARAPRPFHAAVRRHLDRSGVPVESSKGEWGLGQHEMNIRYADILEMADRHVIFKQCLKEIADRHGVSVTFMAKYATPTGPARAATSTSACGATARTRSPATRDLGVAPVAGSDELRWFLGGCIAHVPDVMVLFAPTVNSYKRYVDGSWAPTRVAWSYDNRTAGFRVVGRRPEPPHRVPDPRRRLQPVPRAGRARRRRARRHRATASSRRRPFEGDVYAADELLAPLPRTLRDATDAFAASAFADGRVRRRRRRALHPLLPDRAGSVRRRGDRLGAPAVLRADLRQTMRLAGQGRADHRRGQRHRPGVVPAASRRRARASSASTSTRDDRRGDGDADRRPRRRRGTACTADVSTPTDCEAMVAFAEATFGRLDVLFNNAGVMLSGDDDADHDRRGHLGPHDGHQRQGRVPRLQVRHPGPAARGRRLGHQHRVVRRAHGRRDAAGRLHREQGRGARADPRARRHPRPRGHPRQRALPRSAPHRDADGVPRHRGEAPAAPRPHPDGPLRRGRRDRARRRSSSPPTSRRS